MVVVIREIVSEVTVGEEPSERPGASASGNAMEDEQVERIIRAATERVLEHLRREWER